MTFIAHYWRSLHYDVFSTKSCFRSECRFLPNKCVVFYVSLTLESIHESIIFYLRHVISTLGTSRHITLFTIWMILVYHFVKRLVCVRIVSKMFVMLVCAWLLNFPRWGKVYPRGSSSRTYTFSSDTDRMPYATTLDAYHHASRWKSSTHTLTRLEISRSH